MVEVYSMTGQLVYSEKMVEGNNSISISHLETGVYAIRLVREDGNYSTQRFVKQ